MSVVRAIDDSELLVRTKARQLQEALADAGIGSTVSAEPRRRKRGPEDESPPVVHVFWTIDLTKFGSFDLGKLLEVAGSLGWIVEWGPGSGVRLELKS